MVKIQPHFIAGTLHQRLIYIVFGAFHRKAHNGRFGPIIHIRRCRAGKMGQHQKACRRIGNPCVQKGIYVFLPCLLLLLLRKYAAEPFKRSAAGKGERIAGVSARRVRHHCIAALKQPGILRHTVHQHRNTLHRAGAVHCLGAFKNTRTQHSRRLVMAGGYDNKILPDTQLPAKFLFYRAGHGTRGNRLCKKGAVQSRRGKNFLAPAILADVKGPRARG